MARQRRDLSYGALEESRRLGMALLHARSRWLPHRGRRIYRNGSRLVQRPQLISRTARILRLYRRRWLSVACSFGAPRKTDRTQRKKTIQLGMNITAHQLATALGPLWKTRSIPSTAQSLNEQYRVRHPAS